MAKKNSADTPKVEEGQVGYYSTPSRYFDAGGSKKHGANVSAGSAGQMTIILKSMVQKPESQLTSLEKAELVDEGVSKKDLEHLKKSTQLDYDQLAQILSVARATLINKKGNAKFNRSLSERIISLADIFSYGYAVFEDESKFNHWVFRANQALGGKMPFELLDNQFGREEVKSLIGRIEYGVYS